MGDGDESVEPSTTPILLISVGMDDTPDDSSEAPSLNAPEGSFHLSHTGPGRASALLCAPEPTNRGPKTLRAAKQLLMADAG